MSGSAEEVRKHIATYKKIAAALAVGTVVTVLASYLDVSVPLGITIALIIATTKASLVANYFMHLGEERSAWLKLTVGAHCGLLVGLDAGADFYCLGPHRGRQDAAERERAC